jgi:general secretion pathway protein H
MQAGRGFTLIEVLVVLAILGIVVAAAGLSVRGLAGPSVARETERLRLTLERLAERAQVSGQPLALQLLPGGYRVLHLDAGGHWQPAEGAAEFAERSLPAGFAWRALRTDRGEERPEQLLFAARSPRYRLRLATPDGDVVLRGASTGSVEVLAGAQTPVAGGAPASEQVGRGEPR